MGCGLSLRLLRIEEEIPTSLFSSKRAIKRYDNKYKGFFKLLKRLVSLDVAHSAARPN